MDGVRLDAAVAAEGEVSAWKAFERRLAKRLGLTRRPVTGIDRGDGDCFNALFEVQAKKRKGQPTYLREWLDGIVATAQSRGRIGIVVWKESGKGRNDEDALVILRLRDWQDLHGNVSANGRDQLLACASGDSREREKERT